MNNRYEDEVETTGVVGFIKKKWYWLRVQRLFFIGKVRAWKKSRKK